MILRLHAKRHWPRFREVLITSRISKQLFIICFLKFYAGIVSSHRMGSKLVFLAICAALAALSAFTLFGNSAPFAGDARDFLVSNTALKSEGAVFDDVLMS